jgi:superfamily I DNA/RNA helicase
MQNEAYRNEGSLMIASAGSGKTTAFVKIVHNLIVQQHIDYDAVQVMMFSKQARDDFKQRINKFNATLPKKQRLTQTRIKINTIHSLCYYICKNARRPDTNTETLDTTGEQEADGVGRDKNYYVFV